MNTMLQDVSIQLPQEDLNLLKELAKKMGWKYSIQQNNKTLDIAINDYQEGRVNKAMNIDDLMKQLTD